MLEHDARPLLSICIPTYNRAASLRKLFLNLVECVKVAETSIEICISNNGSTDDTSDVIAEFISILPMKVLHQPSNIGGTLNILEVAKISTGRWGVWVGDDDVLEVEQLKNLLKELSTLSSDTWVLVDANDADGNPQYFRYIHDGSYDLVTFKWTLLRRTLNPYGFMGVHVFPYCALPVLNDLNIQKSQPWPHMAAMLRFWAAKVGVVKLLPQSLVRQAKDGSKLFWTGGDLARIRLARIRILMYGSKDTEMKLFFRALMVRELYSAFSFRSLLAWKLYEADDFRSSGLSTYFKTYCQFSYLFPVTIPHSLVVGLLLIIPKVIYKSFFVLIGKGNLLSQYVKLKKELGIFDGIKRGI